MSSKPIVLIARPGYWSSQFVSLFDEEGYETQDIVDPGTLEIDLLKQKAPYGVISAIPLSDSKNSFREYVAGTLDGILERG